MSRTFACLRRPGGWLVLGGVVLLVVGAAWDALVHMGDAGSVSDVHAELSAVRAHRLLLVGVALIAAGAIPLLRQVTGTHRGCQRLRWTTIVSQLVTIVAVSGVGLLLSTGDGEAPAGHLGTPSAVAAEPSGINMIGSAQRLPAVALYRELMHQPVTEADLPTGFRPVRLEEQPSSDRLRAHNAVGAMNVVIDGPDLGDRVGFRVFMGEDDAAKYFEPTSIGPEFVLTDRFTWAAARHPARCESYTYEGAGRRISATDCLARVRNVVVVGSSAHEGEAGHGDVAHSTALASAGVAHLERILAQQPADEPHEWTSPG